MAHHGVLQLIEDVIHHIHLKAFFYILLIIPSSYLLNKAKKIGKRSHNIVGPVGTRVPMDLYFASPVRWADEIPLSPRRGTPRVATRKESSRGTKYGRMPEETGLTALFHGDAFLYKEVNTSSSRGPSGLLRVASLQRNLCRMHMASAEAAVRCVSPGAVTSAPQLPNW